MSSFEQNSKEITNPNGIISLSIVDSNRLKTKNARDFEKYSHFRSFIAKRALFILYCYSTSAYIWIEVPWEEIACLLNTLLFFLASVFWKENRGVFFVRHLSPSKLWRAASVIWCFSFSLCAFVVLIVRNLINSAGTDFRVHPDPHSDLFGFEPDVEFESNGRLSIHSN